LGFEPNLSDIQKTSLADLTKQVGEAMTQWQTGARVKEEADEIARSSAKIGVNGAQEKSSAGTASLVAVSTQELIRAEPWKVRMATATDAPIVYQPLSWNNSEGTASVSGAAE
jgi:predicted secreted protein